MNATFRQLRLFLALAEHRSITAAARACHVTQPTVSMQLKELSEAVGMPLYEQIGRRLYLTEAGEALAETAQAMVEEWGSFEQRIDGMRGLTRGACAWRWRAPRSTSYPACSDASAPATRRSTSPGAAQP